MSIQSEITRISGNVSNALTAIANKGVTIPTGSNSDDLATLIGQIQVGGDGGAISIVDTPDAAGGMVRTITAVDISDTTAVAGDVAQGKYFYTADGIKTAGTASGGGGGGSNWTLLASDTYAVNLINTTAISVGTLGFSENLAPGDHIWLHVRDTAGKRLGYCYGDDMMSLVGPEGNWALQAIGYVIRCKDDGTYAFVPFSSSTKYGIYINSVDVENKSIEIYAKLSTNITGTINGTFSVDAYKLTPASGMVMFE